MTQEDLLRQTCLSMIMNSQSEICQGKPTPSLHSFLLLQTATEPAAQPAAGTAAPALPAGWEQGVDPNTGKPGSQFGLKEGMWEWPVKLPTSPNWITLDGSIRLVTKVVVFLVLPKLELLWRVGGPDRSKGGKIDQLGTDEQHGSVSQGGR